MSNNGSDVPKYNVTPAEVQVLTEGFRDAVGGNPISDLVITGTVKRSSRKEIERLTREYGSLSIKVDDRKISVLSRCFPGMNARLPMSFDEVGVEGTIGKEEPLKNYDPEPANEGQPVIDPFPDSPAIKTDLEGPIPTTPPAALENPVIPVTSNTAEFERVVKATPTNPTPAAPQPVPITPKQPPPPPEPKPSSDNKPADDGPRVIRR